MRATAEYHRRHPILRLHCSLRLHRPPHRRLFLAPLGSTKNTIMEGLVPLEGVVTEHVEE